MKASTNLSKWHYWHLLGSTSLNYSTSYQEEYQFLLPSSGEPSRTLRKLMSQFLMPCPSLYYYLRLRTDTTAILWILVASSDDRNSSNKSKRNNNNNKNNINRQSTKKPQQKDIQYIHPEDWDKLSREELRNILKKEALG